MKSSNEDLRKRGFITDGDIKKFRGFSYEELLELVNSPIAIERSIAAYLLESKVKEGENVVVRILLKRLCKEKALYTKINICNTLEKGNLEAAQEIINYLGNIGKNQYKELPKRGSKKNSYPLPRDIIARTLSKMNKDILPLLFNVLKGDEEKMIVECIDAMGFLLFYNKEVVTKEYLKLVLDTMRRYSKNQLIVWKCVTCLSAFKGENVQNVLKEISIKSNSTVIRLEAKRSLDLILE